MKRSPTSSGKYTFVFKKNNMDVIKSGELDLSSNKATIDVDSE